MKRQWPYTDHCRACDGPIEPMTNGAWIHVYGDTSYCRFPTPLYAQWFWGNGAEYAKRNARLFLAMDDD